MLGEKDRWFSLARVEGLLNETKRLRLARAFEDGAGMFGARGYNKWWRCEFGELPRRYRERRRVIRSYGLFVGGGVVVKVNRKVER